MKKKFLTFTIAFMAISTFNFSYTVLGEGFVLDKPSYQYSISAKTLKYNGIVYNFIKEPGFVSLGEVSVGNNQNIDLSEINIPNAITIDGKTYEVTGITENAFASNKNITSINIGRSIKNIGENAFYLCQNLEKIFVSPENTYYHSDEGVLYDYKKTNLIKYPDSKQEENYSIYNTVDEISNYAFYNNHHLKRIILNDGLTRIGKYAFANCKYLENATFGNYIEYIGDYAFYQTALKYAHLPRTVTDIGKCAFALSDLITFDIPANIYEIKYGTFYNCSNLSSIKFSSSLKTIGELSFAHTKLTSIEIPDNVFEIGNSAFYNCKYMTKVYFGNSVTSIGEKAFYNCSSISQIDLPKSLIEIKDDAFTNCYSLEVFTAKKGNSYFNVNDGALYDKKQSILIHFPAAASVSTYEMPSSVYKIYKNSLNQCRYINEFSVPSGSRYFYTENGVLYNYTQSEIIRFPIGQGATNFTIKENVETIADRAFEGTYISGSINIPSTLKEIGEYAFDNCVGVTSYNVDNNNKNFSSQDGVLYNYDKTVLIKYPSGLKRKSFKIPETVIEIREGAFKDTDIKTITFNKNLQKIGDNAFENSSIENIELLSSVEDIGEYAFASTDIETINIPKSVSYLGNFAFKDCSNLKLVYFEAENPPKKISQNAFLNCYALSEINVPQGNYIEYYNSLLELNIDNIANIIK